MLHSYKVKNFFSFHEETSVSFVQNEKSVSNHSATERLSGNKVSKVMAVLGANGSGKTTLLKPLAFINWFISKSFHFKHDSDIPIEPHFFSESENIEVEIIFDWNGALWKYSLALSKKRVIKESLYQKHAEARTFSYVFIREWIDNNYEYKHKPNIFGFTKREAQKTRPNASLISTAAQYDVPLALLMVDTLVFTNISYGGRTRMNDNHLFYAAEIYKDNPNLNRNAINILKRWDLGLTDINIHDIDYNSPDSDREEKIYIPFGVHTCGEKKAEIPLAEESSGTQSAYVLLTDLLPALNTGGLAVIDELESDLHPHMLQLILDLFINPETNPYDAQLIFTCHSAEILHCLNKTQIVLAEKDDQCVSHAWRLDEIKGIRPDENLYAKYMAGSYGGVPYL